MKSRETKTKAPSTLGCPIERIDASASEIFSKELTPLSPLGIDASTFFFSLLARSASRSIVLGYGLKGNSCPGRNSERNDSMIPVCVCVLFKTCCFRVFLRLIVRNVSVDRAKDLSTIQSSRRKETRLSDF